MNATMKVPIQALVAFTALFALNFIPPTSYSSLGEKMMNREAGCSAAEQVRFLAVMVQDRRCRALGRGPVLQGIGCARISRIRTKPRTIKIDGTEYAFTLIPKCPLNGNGRDRGIHSSILINGIPTRSVARDALLFKIVFAAL